MRRNRVRTATDPSRPRRWLRRRSERGAALVEFALVSIPLFTILFGTIEFGWAFFQLNDIRHGAREGIRLVVVASEVVPTELGWSSEGERLAQATCERMDQKNDVVITIDLVDLDANGVLDVGDDVVLTASKPISQLTKVFDPVLGGVTLNETITSRLEQDPPAGVDGTTWGCL